MKIRTIFLLTFSLIAAVVIGFFYRWTTDEIRPSYLKVVEENLVDTSRLLASLIQEQMVDDNWDTGSIRRSAENLREDRFVAKIFDSEKLASDLRFYVTDSRGIVWFHSHDPQEEGKDYSRWIDVARTLRGEYGARSTRMDPEDPATSHLHVAAPIENGSGLIAVVTVIKPIDWPYRFMEESRQHILLGATVLGVCALALVIGLSFWLSRPLERLTAHAQRIRRGERAPAPRPGGSTEIRRLQSAFEEMRRGLEGRKYVETYVANLTHEIKSPLAGLRSAAEILAENPPEIVRQRFVGHVRSEVDRIQKVVDQMLILSELEGKDSLDHREKVCLAKLVDELIDEYRPSTQARSVRLEAQVTTDRTFIGDPVLLRLALGSIVQNAIEFSPARGSVRIGVGEDGGRFEISVTDDGPGVPEYARQRVFERLFSLPRPNGGAKSSGLGLSLAREIVELHGGSIELQCPSGGGTKVQIVLVSKAESL